MNFLGHAWLSGNDLTVMAANVTGDAFKGVITNIYSPNFKAGLQLHRFIDQSTDSHEELKSASQILKPYYGRYAGVALDIWIDHFLASQFETYHGNALPEFVKQVYKSLKENEKSLNSEALQLAKIMVSGDWLNNYRNKIYVENVFSRMAIRFNAQDLVKNGHPNEDDLKEIALIFNSLAFEFKARSNQKLLELLNTQHKA